MAIPFFCPKLRLFNLEDMIFNRAERSGAIILVLALIGIIVIPRQVLPKSHNIFLLTAPVEVEQDSIAISTQPRTPAYKKRYAKTSNPVELNSADSMALIAIRGIGPYYSSRILRYRERLGGYYSVKQLKELRMKYFDVDSNAHLFTVNPSLIQKKDLDTMSFKSILRHPYLEYEDVQMIFNAKRQFDSISYSILEKESILPAYKLKKIKPYFK